MNKKLTYFIVTVFFILIGLLILSWAADYYIEHKIETLLANKQFEKFEIDDYEIDVKSRSGSVYINHLSLSEPEKPLTKIKITALELKGLSLYQLLVSNSIIIRELSIEKAHLSIDKSSEFLQENKTEESSFLADFEQIKLEKIAIKQLYFEIITDASQQLFQIDNMSLTIADFNVNQDLENSEIPFDFKEFSLKNGKVSYLISEFDELEAKEIEYQHKNFKISDFSIQTIYDRVELSKMLETERDHFNLKIPSLEIKNFEASKNNSNLRLKTSKLILNQPKLQVYRDKQVKKDTSFKALYSKTLRELPFKITVDSARINQAKITYEERIEDEEAPGKIKLSELSADISNLSNTYPANRKKTNISVTSIFMDKTPLEAKWNFDMNNISDEFIFEAKLGNLAAENFNSFTENHLKVQLEGELKKTYLTINGNNDRSNTAMKLAYNDFKVEIVGEEGNKKNILTELTKIFISEDNDANKNNEVQAEAERDKTRSFFNFIWVSISAALKELFLNN
ncbi:MAG: hypothetical protein ACQESK_06875 [Bacteroidota bacterium]